MSTMSHQDPSNPICGLFIGDLDDVCDYATLCDFNIETVVNLCPEQLQKYE